VSRDGTLVYAASSLVGTGQLVWVNRAGEDIELIGTPQQGLIWPKLSPDNTRAGAMATETGAHKIWIHNLDRGTRRLFSVTGGHVWITAWVSDDQLAYTSGSRTHIRSVTRSDPPELLVDEDSLTISSDRRYTATENRFGESLDIYYSDLQEGGGAQLLVASDATEADPAIRPAGGWLAYVSNETGRYEVYLVRLPSGEGKRQVSVNGGANPRWSRNSNELFYQTERTDNANLMVVGVTTEPDLQLTEPQLLFSGADANINIERDWCVSSDGQRILGIRNVITESETRRITVVENWHQEYEKP